MNIFEILGPVMVGPSSSHTAGAVRIGYISRQLLGEPVKDATLGLYGSFWLTGSGHGTPLALIAGLCGMHPDDARIPRAFAVAKARGMTFRLEQAKLKNAHPNSVQLHLVGESGKVLDLIGQSLGGSIINIAEIDGLEANVSGDYPTLIVSNTDVPGMVAKISALLAQAEVNIAEMRLYRSGRGKRAAFIAECDQEIPAATIAAIRALEGIKKVSYLSLEETPCRTIQQTRSCAAAGTGRAPFGRWCLPPRPRKPNYRRVPCWTKWTKWQRPWRTPSPSTTRQR